MKILGRIPYDTSLDVPFRRCDLCDISEYDGLLGNDPLSLSGFIPMFKAEEDDVEYVLCATCADKEAGGA